MSADLTSFLCGEGFCRVWVRIRKRRLYKSFFLKTARPANRLWDIIRLQTLRVVVNRWKVGKAPPNYKIMRKIAEYCDKHNISFDTEQYLLHGKEDEK